MINLSPEATRGLQYIIKGKLKQKGTTFFTKLTPEMKDDLIQEVLTAALSSSEIDWKSYSQTTRISDSSLQKLDRIAGDVWNKFKRGEGSGREVRSDRDISFVAARREIEVREKESEFGQRTDLDAAARSETLFDIILNLPTAGRTKANIAKMHLGYLVLPNQPSSTVGRYLSKQYEPATSRAYQDLRGIKVSARLRKSDLRKPGLSQPGEIRVETPNQPRYHGQASPDRVVLWEGQEMKIVSLPRSKQTGLIELLPLSARAVLITITANPSTLILAPCPTCTDIARFLRIPGLTGDKVQQFMDVDLARLAMEHGLGGFIDEQET
jgi:hypothetical protein